MGEFASLGKFITICSIQCWFRYKKPRARLQAVL